MIRGSGLVKYREYQEYGYPRQAIPRHRAMVDIIQTVLVYPQFAGDQDEYLFATAINLI